MSYYKSECSGPYTRNGQRIEAFSIGSVLRIADCIGTVPQRQSLVDVCGINTGVTWTTTVSATTSTCAP